MNFRGAFGGGSQREKKSNLAFGASPLFCSHFRPAKKYFLPTKIFLFDQIEFPEFCDMMASKMSDNDDEEAVR